MRTLGAVGVLGVVMASAMLLTLFQSLGVAERPARAASGDSGAAALPRAAEARLSALLRAQQRREAEGTPQVNRITKSNEEWRAELDELSFRVTREGATERPFSSDLLNEKRPGHYTAIGGTVPIFSSDKKFDSGTGWPSFFDVVDEAHVTLHEDDELGVRRIEVRCAQTGHHLGHVFEDGPAPTGLRYCINAAALRFVPQGE